MENTELSLEEQALFRWCALKMFELDLADAKLVQPSESEIVQRLEDVVKEHNRKLTEILAKIEEVKKSRLSN